MSEHSSNYPEKLNTPLGVFIFREEYAYPNGARSLFYTCDNMAVILDDGICDEGENQELFPYSMITSKQNEYMNKYEKVYRFLYEDQRLIEEYLGLGQSELTPGYIGRVGDRGDYADVSPLELFFEDHFSKVYGSDSVKYLWKEYGITDLRGGIRYLDYFVRTSNGSIAVEENGVNYHHPQIIGAERYRKQLLKQNSCTAAGIRLFRFSSEDCRFEDRFEDDIKAYFGDIVSNFKENGMVVDRPFVLYEHQENTLEEMLRQREQGIRSFLVVFPTASGKSRIVEEDMRRFAKKQAGFHGLVLVPNRAVKMDWEHRIRSSLAEYETQIQIVSYAYMERHFTEYDADAFDYIVVDEAHHAVAPGLKRTIQYFDPKFLVGLTATDERPDKKKLESVFGAYRVGLSLQEAMEKGIVARANAFRIETNIDLSRVRINGKDYVNADLEKTVRITSRNELIVNVIQEYFTEGEAGRRQGLIFCVNTNHASEMERLLTKAGVSARAYSSKSRHPEQIIQEFKEKKIRFLCTCQMISEGWDYPELGILIMARPTLSKVLYLQQLGRGLRKTSTKRNVFVIDVVDEYGSMVQPCSLHSIFKNPYYVPFGDVACRNYAVGDMITIDGITERVERITEIDIQSFDEKYGDYLSQEQLAREFYVSTGTITSWINNKKIQPSVTFAFGSKKIHMFSPEDATAIREKLQIKEHSDETIKEDFFDFLEERDYSLSYKMPFLLSFLKNMDASGDAKIEDVLRDYIAFYEDRLEKGLPVDRKTCPYTTETLKDTAFVKRNMLNNPFEKFERKRFLYYSKDLNILSMNHALHGRLEEGDYERIVEQMKADLVDYYAKLER